ncbi:MAG: hypothetical protein HGA96_14015 [Desulfobulbaceae bacterium]|nr:hypothetical protein [Desulfobulbaceae bacterium]
MKLCNSISLNILLIFETIFGIALFFCLCSCGNILINPVSSNYCESFPDAPGLSNISLFLNIDRKNYAPAGRIKVISTELLIDDIWVPFSAVNVELSSNDPIIFQKYIGRQWVKGQSCFGIKVKVAVNKISDSVNDLRATEIAFESELLLQNPLSLMPGSRNVLFLEWNPTKSFSNLNMSSQSLTVSSSAKDRISENLLYVACPDIDTVYVVRADRYQVVDAFEVQGKPSYISVDSINKKLYVLAESTKKLIPLDIKTYYPGNEIIISLATSPNFMFVNANRDVAYVLDDYGVITSIDLISGNMINRNRIGTSCNYICYLSYINKLAISSSLDQTVYIVNPDNLIVDDSIKLGSAPFGMISLNNYLYIAEGDINTVIVYDLSTKKIVKSVHVGFEPMRFVSTFNSVYVTNFGDGSLSIIQGEQFNVSKELPVGESAREMVLMDKQKLIFVGEGECYGSLVAVDATANQVVARIELGARPLGIAATE